MTEKMKIKTRADGYTVKVYEKSVICGTLTVLLPDEKERYRFAYELANVIDSAFNLGRRDVGAELRRIVNL